MAASGSVDILNSNWQRPSCHPGSTLSKHKTIPSTLPLELSLSRQPPFPAFHFTPTSRHFNPWRIEILLLLPFASPFNGLRRLYSISNQAPSAFYGPISPTMRGFILLNILRICSILALVCSIVAACTTLILSFKVTKVLRSDRISSLAPTS